MNRIVNGVRKRVKSAVVKVPIAHRAAKKIKKLIKRERAHSPQTSISYSRWIATKEPLLWSDRKLKRTPLISVIVPTYNTPDKYLNPLIESVIAQSYSNWELCISDASTSEERQEAIEAIALRDKRIKYEHNEKLHISDNTNKALNLAKGEFIALLDHDDLLAPQALQEVAVVVNNNSDVDVIYSDEDKISDDGKERLLPFFKPDWSPDLLLGVNYITHFLVVRRSLLKKTGLLNSQYDGAQDYDLILRLTELSNRIVHIPKILYHWRLADGSTAKSAGEKNYADTAGQDALRAAVKRRGLKAKVVGIPGQPTNYRLVYSIPSPKPLVSIIIPFKDKADLLRQCVESILSRSTYKRYEIILISNNSVEVETKNLLTEFSKRQKIKVYEWNYPFNYSKINNFGVSKANGEYVILLNNDTEVITGDWIQELVSVAAQPDVGAVGPMLLYPDDKDGIQHAGVVLGMGTMAGHVFRHRQPNEWTDFGLPSWPRNYLAVTAACVAISKDKYREVGGLDEVFTVAGNDVALCLSLYEKGYKNIYWPFAKLKHYESISVGTYNNGIRLDYDHSLKYYRPYHEQGDKYFNENLDLMNEQVGIRG